MPGSGARATTNRQAATEPIRRRERRTHDTAHAPNHYQALIAQAVIRWQPVTTSPPCRQPGAGDTASATTRKAPPTSSPRSPQPCPISARHRRHLRHRRSATDIRHPHRRAAAWPARNRPPAAAARPRSSSPCPQPAPDAPRPSAPRPGRCGGRSRCARCPATRAGTSWDLWGGTAGCAGLVPATHPAVALRAGRGWLSGQAVKASAVSSVSSLPRKYVTLPSRRRQ
jgi:hypothetical protein